ncbi:hypothetical protein HPB50_027002 [Hyalomma asiaticum]|uniref:Uncharacterized protein n=1 Tax=Hyalomma asiaticum TaxID=266040 RepID=A0ACB7TMW4_HYAAI|nr:hypothetical protein HPB50_027002 [Hyalomma asiaticum]
MAASGVASPMCSANTVAVRPVRKFGRHMRICEDLCLLRGVTAANAFENTHMWEHVLRKRPPSRARFRVSVCARVWDPVNFNLSWRRPAVASVDHLGKDPR